MKENDKNTRRKTQDLKKKGFYTALYSSIGALAIIAVVFAYSNLSKNPSTEGKNLTSKGLTSIEQETATVNQSKDPSYTKAGLEGEIGSALIIGGEDELTKKQDAEKEDSLDSDKVKSNKTETPAVTPKDSDTQEKKAEPSSSKEKDPETVILPLDSENAVESDSSEALDEKVEPPVNTQFANFDENSKMDWPVLGEVVMEFSTDKLIYDKTLEQYRTNETVAIASPIGTQVVASAEGIVKGVENSKELGNYVVIDHGNGWVTTYSQLQDNVLVKAGDIVKTGQVIGGVGNPSIYTVLLGSHLGFEVSKDTVALNPFNVLKNK